jgi:ubiquitin-protein ligase
MLIQLTRFFNFPVLQSICALMEEPNPDSYLEATIAEVLKTDPARYDKNAREWTRTKAPM